MKSPKKIKILRIIARLNIGGPAIHAILLSASLNNSKYETFLVCGSLSEKEGDMSYYALEKGVKFNIIPCLKRKISFFSDICAFCRIYLLICRLKPDIIHTHTAKAGSLGRTAALVYNFLPWHKKIKIVHTFHGHVLSGYFGRLKTNLFILIERFLAFFTDMVITVSDSVKEELLKLKIVSAGKIKVIPLGFELEKFLLLPPKTGGNSFNVGIIGRLVPIKNHRLFLDAAFKLAGRDLDISFKIVGDGEDRQKLENYAKELGIKKVEFLGWKNDLPAVYSGLDLVVLTSLNEGTPVSLIEAMASSRVVISTDVGGVRDLMGEELKLKVGGGFRIFERGILVKSGDSKALTNAISFILSDLGLRNELAVAGRKYTEKVFSKARLTGDIEDLYEKLL